MLFKISGLTQKKSILSIISSSCSYSHHPNKNIVHSSANRVKLVHFRNFSKNSSKDPKNIPKMFSSFNLNKVLDTAKVAAENAKVLADATKTAVEKKIEELNASKTSASSNATDAAIPSAPPSASTDDPPVASVAETITKQETVAVKGTASAASSESSAGPVTNPTTGNVALNTFLMKKIPCHCCQSTANTYDNFLSFSNNRCKICYGYFCNKCIEKSKFPIPREILHSEERRVATPTHAKGTVATSSDAANAAAATATAEDEAAKKQPADKAQYLCKDKCLPYATQFTFDLFRKSMNDQFGPIVREYISIQQQKAKLNNHSEEDKEVLNFFPLPETLEDTTYRKALRIAQVAEIVADFTPLKNALKAMKYAYYSHELITMLISSDMFAVLAPLMDQLKLYEITGPTALLNLYYLGCKHTLEHKQTYSTLRRDFYDPKKYQGVLMQDCPHEVIDYISRYVSPAQWLYTSKLPPPHSDDNEWCSWYLSKMIRRQQWVLLMSMSDSTKLPSGEKCPAFALVARNAELPVSEQFGNSSTDKGSATKSRKEAMLVVRGSNSMLDWSINFQEAMAPFQYHYYSTKESKVKVVDGHCHSGFRSGTLGILDGYGIRQHLTDLFDEGYDIKIVGHSLGAGVSSLIAADLRSSLIKRVTAQLEEKGIDVKNMDTKYPQNSFTAYYDVAHRVNAVVFSSPAIISQRLAAAFLEDRLLINVVNGTDIIPRYNRRTMATLANELKDFSATANTWMEEDKLDFIDYAYSVGKAQDIRSSTADKRKERWRRLQDIKEKKDNRDKAIQDKELAKQKAAEAPSTTEYIATSINSQFETVNTQIDHTVKQINTQATELYSYAATSIFETYAKLTKKAAATDDSNGKVEEISVVVATPVTEMEMSDEPLQKAPPAKPPKRTPITTITTDAAVTDGKVVAEDSPNSATAHEFANMTDDSSIVIKATPVEGKVVASATIVDDDELMVGVTPSPIVHLYRENNGMMTAAVVTHEHELFNRMELLPARLTLEHEIKSYRTSVNGVKHTMGFVSQQRQANAQRQHYTSNLAYTSYNSATAAASSSLGYLGEDKNLLHSSALNFFAPPTATKSNSIPSTPVAAKSLFPKDVERNLENELPYLVRLENQTPNAQSILGTAINGQIISDEKLTNDSRDLRAHLQKKLSQDIELETTGTIVKDVDYQNGKAIEDEETIVWLPCSVCGLEVTWPYITHSDAGRAMATHNCSACGRIVCTVCAPAGDKLKGDGISTTHNVSDFRVPLPWLGIYSEQRVCCHCYFDSTYPGLSTRFI